VRRVLRLPAARLAVRLPRPEEIPAIAGNIEEYRNLPIDLGARGSDERDARRGHARVGRVEVVDTQEQSDPAGKLLPDGRSLFRPICPRQQQPRRAAFRPHDDPSFGPPVVRRRRRVLDEVEVENADEEVDGRVVVVDDQRREIDVAH
jgi:hypothetical protein